MLLFTGLSPVVDAVGDRGCWGGDGSIGGAHGRREPRPWLFHGPENFCLCAGRCSHRPVAVLSSSNRCERASLHLCDPSAILLLQPTAIPCPLTNASSSRSLPCFSWVRRTRIAVHTILITRRMQLVLVGFLVALRIDEEMPGSWNMGQVREQRSKLLYSCWPGSIWLVKWPRRDGIEWPLIDGRPAVWFLPATFLQFRVSYVLSCLRKLTVYIGMMSRWLGD